MSLINRLYYKITANTVGPDGIRERVQCEEGEADLVSSLRADGTHAPVFDIDMPVTHTRIAHGASTLRVHGEGKSRHMLGFIESLTSLRLVHRSARDAYYADPHRTTPRMAFPELPLSVPAEVLASSTQGHFHLILDASLSWSEYDSLLERAQRCALIDMEYLILCRREEKGFLWLPGRKQAWMREFEREKVGAEARVRELNDALPYYNPHNC